MKENYEKLFSIENFIYASILVMCLNSIAWFKIAKVSQLASVLLAGYGVVSIINGFINQKYKFDFPGWQISFLIVLSSLLAFAGNKFGFVSKNIYSLLSVFFNFFIFYSLAFNDVDNVIFKNCLKIILIFTVISAVVNIFMYFLNVSIPLFEYVDIKDSRFVGIDIVRHRFTGLSGNANGLSRVALVSIFVSSMVGVFSKTTKPFKIFLSINIILNTTIIYLSQSRGAINSLSMFLIFIPVTVVIHSLIKENKLLKVLVGFSLVGLLFVASLNITPKLSTVFVQNINEQQGETIVVDRNEADEITAGDVSNGRFTLIKNGVAATLKINPIFGLTYGGNTIQVQKYLDSANIAVPAYIYAGAGSMHNTIVQAFINCGLIGLIALLIFLINAITNIIKLNFAFPVEKEYIFTIAIMNAVVSSILLLSMVEWVFYFDYDNHLVNFLLLYSLGWFLKQTLNREETAYE